MMKLRLLLLGFGAVLYSVGILGSIATTELTGEGAAFVVTASIGFIVASTMALIVLRQSRRTYSTKLRNAAESISQLQSQIDTLKIEIESIRRQQTIIAHHNH